MPDIWVFAAVITKTLMYFGFLTAGGLVLTRIVFASHVAAVLPAMRIHAAIYTLLGAGAAVVGFAVRGAALTGDATGLIDPEMLGLLWQTPVGTALAFRLAGSGLMLTGLLIGGLGWGLAGLGALAALWSFSAIGHLSDGSGFWPKLVLITHLSAVAFWIGILLPLSRLIDPMGDMVMAGRLGHRFGQIASVIIPGLFVAGLVLGWLLLGSWANLFSTSYGLALVAKLCLVSALLGLGAWNKMRVVPGLISGNGRAAAHLSRSLMLEWLLFLAAFSATAALTTMFALPEMH